VDSVLSSTSIPEFSERFSVVLYGYKSAEDYYQKASCVNYILTVQTPLLVVNALDDPRKRETHSKFSLSLHWTLVVPASSIPFQEFEKNPFLLLGVTSFGGHLGWADYKCASWMNRICLEYIYLQKSIEHRTTS
jgi:predicted alpha/beta-fold hydrolase